MTKKKTYKYTDDLRRSHRKSNTDLLRRSMPRSTIKSAQNRRQSCALSWWLNDGKETVNIIITSMGNIITWVQSNEDGDGCGGGCNGDYYHDDDHDYDYDDGGGNNDGDAKDGDDNNDGDDGYDDGCCCCSVPQLTVLR